jgi:hypothetical protein
MGFGQHVLVPSAGWYHDPSDAHVLRWWDGERWTPHVVHPAVANHRAASNEPTARAILLRLAPLVAVFTVTNLVASLLWDQPYPLDLLLYQLVFCPVLASPLLVFPAWILAAGVRSRNWTIVAELALAVLTACVVVALVTDEHSTAGFVLIYLPILGSAIAGATTWVSRSGTNPVRP